MLKKIRNQNKYEIKKGDIVTRKSYEHDIIFIVKKIIKLNDRDIAIIKGCTLRIEASATIDDLVKVDKKEFVEQELDITEIISKDELIEVLNTIQISANKYYKIIFTGKRNFEINIYEILKLIENKNIIKIKDNTSMKIDLLGLAEQKSLKGIFVKNMLEKITEENREDIIKAIEIGLEAM